MARIEKTVFISYRRTDVYTALAVYENLKNQGYDVFFDYRSISSGDFEQIITSNIRARAHFILILTPTALDRCNEPGDWLRREIELAIDEKRNIIPLFFKGFRFGAPSQSGITKLLRLGKPDVMTGKLRDLSRYNGLRVHEDYFDEAMVRLRTEYLNKQLETILHPVSTEVQKVVEEEQKAADEALKHKDEITESAKLVEEKPIEKKVLPKQIVESDNNKVREPEESLGPVSTEVRKAVKKKQDAADEALRHREDIKEPVNQIKGKSVEEKELPKPVLPKSEKKEVMNSTPVKGISYRLIGGIGGAIAIIVLLIWGGSSLWSNTSANKPQLTAEFLNTVVAGTRTGVTQTSQAVNASTPSPTETNIPSPTPMPTLGIGSTMTGKDGMTLLYVPAGEFMMGSEEYDDSEKPVHAVYLKAFWIDQTEVTNAMYTEFLNRQGNQVEGGATWLDANGIFVRIHLDGSIWKVDSGYEDHPVVEVSWYGAKAYCSWTERRLPTEAEWEKAARGTEGRTYPWGEEIDSTFGNYNNNNDDTALVGSYSKGASPYGALDMAGNVWEWVEDWFDANYYLNSQSSNPQGPVSGPGRVVRGGGWYGNLELVRSANRNWHISTFTDDNIGFRCAMDAE